MSYRNKWAQKENLQTKKKVVENFWKIDRKEKTFQWKKCAPFFQIRKRKHQRLNTLPSVIHLDQLGERVISAQSINQSLLSLQCKASHYSGCGLQMPRCRGPGVYQCISLGDMRKKHVILSHKIGKPRKVIFDRALSRKKYIFPKGIKRHMDKRQS